MSYLAIAFYILAPALILVFFLFQRRSSQAKPEPNIPVETNVVENKKEKMVKAKPSKGLKQKKDKIVIPKDEMYYATVKGHTEPIDCFCWSRDGKLLATSAADGIIRINIISTIANPNPKYLRIPVEGDMIDAMDFSADNKYLVCAYKGTKEMGVYKLSMEGGSLYKRFPIERNGYVDHVYVSGTGDKMCVLVVCKGKDTVIRVYDAFGSLKARVDNAQIENYCSSYNYDRDFFSTGSFAPDTKVYSMMRSNSSEYQKFGKVMILAGPHSSVYDVSFDRNNRVGVVSKEGGFYFWNIDVRYQVGEDPHIISRIDFSEERFMQIILHPTKDIAVGVYNMAAVLFNPVDGEVLKRIESLGSNTLKDIKTSPSGECFATLCMGEKHINLWRFP